MENTLKILIEGDASGLTSQLKKAGSTITTFVASMNRQEVDWTSILSKTISPAIISGIAATFATALIEAVQFQNSMTQAANTSTEAFQTNSNAVGEAALATQAATGQSAGTIADAMGYAAQALGNVTDGTNLVAEASKYATATGIPLMTLVQELVPVLEKWGIAGADVVPTIDDLFGAAAQGKIAITDLLTSMANTGPMLAGKVSIQNASASLEALSNEAGLTAPNAMLLFQKTAEAAFGDVNVIAGLESIGTNMKTFNTAISQGNMAGALSAVDKSLGNIAGNSGKIAVVTQALGVSDSQLANMSKASDQWKIILGTVNKIQSSEASEGDYIKGNTSLVMKLKEAWGTVLTDLTGVGNFLVGTLTNDLQGVDALLNPGKTTSTLSNLFLGTDKGGNMTSSWGNFFSNLFGGGAFTQTSGKSTTPAGNGNTSIYVISSNGALTPGNVSNIPASAKPAMAAQGYLPK